MIRIINDVHIGTSRKAGTTPASQAALREYIFEKFDSLLVEDTTIINGDLFDGFEVPTADLLLSYEMLSNYLEYGHLVMVMGNHDYSAKQGRISSFHLLCHFLQARFGDKVEVIDHTKGLTKLACADNIWAIPHMINQDLFNMEIEKAYAGGGRFLLLHANYDNVWAEEADHSLNVSEQQADKLIAAGWTLIFGHEHQKRVEKGVKVVISGNQIPTSIADNLGCTAKHFTTIEGDEFTLEPMLAVADVFARVDWRDLDHAPDKHFIRVEGTASADEASEVVNAVAALRQRSNAFCISNAVKVDGLAEFDKLAEMSYADVTSFDVLECLLAELEPREQETVQELLK